VAIKTVFHTWLHLELLRDDWAYNSTCFTQQQPAEELQQKPPLKIVSVGLCCVRGIVVLDKW
jgi:hypothetical protein